METNYERLKGYLNAKYEYLAAMGKHTLPEREGLECEYQWRMMIDIMEYVDKLDQLEEIVQSAATPLTTLGTTGNLTLLSNPNAPSQNK